MYTNWYMLRAAIDESKAFYNRGSTLKGNTSSSQGSPTARTYLKTAAVGGRGGGGFTAKFEPFDRVTLLPRR